MKFEDVEVVFCYEEDQGSRECEIVTRDDEAYYREVETVDANGVNAATGEFGADGTLFLDMREGTYCEVENRYEDERMLSCREG